MPQSLGITEGIHLEFIVLVMPTTDPTELLGPEAIGSTKRHNTRILRRVARTVARTGRGATRAQAGGALIGLERNPAAAAVNVNLGVLCVPVLAEPLETPRSACVAGLNR